MITSRREYRFYLESDRKALGIKKPSSVLQRIKAVMVPHPIWKWERQLRKLEYLMNVEMKSSNPLRQFLGGGKL